MTKQHELYIQTLSHLKSNESPPVSRKGWRARAGLFFFLKEAILMACVNESTTIDFSNNGLGAVSPQPCSVLETLNGEWERPLVHLIDENGKWLRMTEGRILHAPVPAAMTPQIDIAIPATTATWIYKINTSSGNLHLRSGTGTGD